MTDQTNPVRSRKLVVLAAVSAVLIALCVLVATAAVAQPGQGRGGPRPGGGRGGPRQGGGGQPPGQQVFDMSQTLSEGAQLHTIAFSGFAFLTGSLGADSFFPPGKVADWWGFQHLRDNDPSRLGHNTDFLTKAAYNMLYVLSDEQRAQLIALARQQVEPINNYALWRFPLMQAFRRQLAGDIPAGSQGLDKAAVEQFSAQLYRLDGELSIERAEVMGGILHGLNAEQRAYLDKLKGTGMATWPDVPETVDRRSMPHDAHVAVMTYAGDMFSWYMGDVEADVYFCPERQGTYFGGFYLKDAPAMGNPNYTISDHLTGDVGATMIEKLNAAQAERITSLVPAQLPVLQQIVEVRRAIATELRKCIAGEAVDKAAVLALSEKYGRLDGEIIYGDAMAYAQVGQSMSAQQKADFAAMRQQIGVGVPQGAFFYSQPIDMPQIPSTDSLFGVQ
jgi:Spy/CpxP family protein refolding chaperone